MSFLYETILIGFAGPSAPAGSYNTNTLPEESGGRALGGRAFLSASVIETGGGGEAASVHFISPETRMLRRRFGFVRRLAASWWMIVFFPSHLDKAVVINAVAFGRFR